MTAQLETQEAGLRHGLQGSGALKLDNPGIDAGEEEQEGLLRPSLKFTGHQLFYVFGLDGVGAMVLSGGVNFALAYREFLPFFFLTARFVAGKGKMLTGEKLCILRRIPSRTQFGCFNCRTHYQAMLLLPSLFNAS
jgi:hypothetical protein